MISSKNGLRLASLCSIGVFSTQILKSVKFLKRFTTFWFKRVNWLPWLDPTLKAIFRKKVTFWTPMGGGRIFFYSMGKHVIFFLYLTEQNAVDWYCSSIILIKINTVRTHVTIFSFLKLDQKWPSYSPPKLVIWSIFWHV